MATPQVVVHADGDLLARAVAARAVTTLVDAQAARGHASVVLTGGGIGTETLRRLAEAPARDAIDWSNLEVWWGDERFLPPGDPQRNETQARAALLEKVPIDPARVHPMGAAGLGLDAESAAEAYRAELARAARPEDHGPVPTFDLLLLGIGPEGHVASLFPESPAIHDARSVVAVHGCPKPPPTRISLTLTAINSAREVWVLASGAEKAKAVRLALSGAGPLQLPAAGVAGRAATRFLIDRAAASDLPPGILR
ncbi:MAG: 6-phosphogluconolactonase [Mycobacteriales bacterium]